MAGNVCKKEESRTSIKRDEDGKWAAQIFWIQ